MQSDTSNLEKVLLVEDNPVNCEVAVDMLEAMGVDTDIANNGQQALDLFKNNQYALILMDCEMPVMDGFTATEQLRKQESERQLKPTPIIALTAHALCGIKEKCQACGMDDLLSKPFSMYNLHSLLKKWLTTGPVDYSARPVRNDEEIARDNDSYKSRIDSGTLDHAVLQKLYAKQKKDGSNLANKVIAIYLEQSSRLLSDFKKAIELADIEALRMTAHTLKSSSANVGALGLSGICREIEQNCIQGKIDDSLVQQLYKSFSEVEESLHSVLKNISILQS